METRNTAFVDNCASAYMSYQNMVGRVTEGMNDVGEVCEALPLEEHARTLQDRRQHMEEHMFKVGIMGEFKRGKSTVINALLGKKIVPADILPCTATPNYIRWDSAPRAEVHFIDGTVKEVSVDQLEHYVTKITTESEEMAATVSHSVVFYPCAFCQNGVEIVDTPGLNDDERMTRISEEIIPTLDAIIMVLAPDSPFSESEANFVRNKVFTSDLSRIIFVLNKIDNIDEEDRPRMLRAIREKIEKSVLNKTADIYGADSSEYAAAKDKIDGIRLYGISARTALRARVKGDDAMLRESGMPQFEAALARLLTEERGLLQLLMPLNTVVSIATEAKNAINMRREACKMDQAEFDKAHNEAVQAIEESRRREHDKVRELRGKASNLYNDLLPTVEAIYQGIEKDMLEYADNVAFTDEDGKTEKSAQAAAERVAVDMKADMQQRLSNGIEKLSVSIQDRIGQDAADLQSFVEDISSRLESAGSFSVKASTQTREDMVNAAIGAGMATIFGGFVAGLGGVLCGWKANGVTGALVGGGAATVAAIGAGMLAFAGLGMVGLPLAMIMGAAGAFGGRAAVSLAFRKKLQQRRVEETRAQLREIVRAAMTEARGQRLLENWLKDATYKAYNALSELLQTQMEATLNGMESTLTEIKVEMAKGKAENDSYLSTLNSLDEKLDHVCALILPVRQKLNDALNTETAAVGA